MTITVWSVFPELGNIHGDAGNADVLAARARWRGLDATVLGLPLGAAAPATAPDAIVIGSGFDADAVAVRDGLRALEAPIRAALADGVPLLAVGLGWELCSTGVEGVAATGLVDGLAIFPGRAIAAERTTGDVAVDSEWGLLLGYEYHLRDYAAAAGERPIGRVAVGLGHGAGAGVEGSVVGTAFGTALRGPVLARNGRFADHLLGLALVRHGIALPHGGAELARVDGWNAAIAARTERALGLH